MRSVQIHVLHNFPAYILDVYHLIPIHARVFDQVGITIGDLGPALKGGATIPTWLQTPTRLSPP